jgi:hypothetical protein
MAYTEWLCYTTVLVTKCWVKTQFLGKKGAGLKPNFSCLSLTSALRPGLRKESPTPFFILQDFSSAMA